MSKAKTYQGNPCKKAGHTERYVSSRNCVVCKAVRDKEYFAENIEKCKADRKKWKAENPEKHTAYSRKHQINNPKLYAYNTSLRRARIKKATPKCVCLKAIKLYYLACPDGYEVDHIYPVSKGGLHMLSNFQYLTAHDNRVKGAKILDGSLF